LITLQSDYKGVSIRPSPRGHRSRVVNNGDDESAEGHRENADLGDLFGSSQPPAAQRLQQILRCQIGTKTDEGAIFIWDTLRHVDAQHRHRGVTGCRWQEVMQRYSGASLDSSHHIRGDDQLATVSTGRGQQTRIHDLPQGGGGEAEVEGGLRQGDEGHGL